MSELIIQCDSREQGNELVLEYFDKVGQKYFVSKVAGGDYINFKAPKVSIDLKASLLELANNLTKDHERFKREIAVVQNDMKCDFVVLIREPLNSLEAVKNWSSSRTKLKGEQLYKIMQTMASRYQILWRFCSREDAGKKIIDILEWYD
jgi:hypothetical protein